MVPSAFWANGRRSIRTSACCATTIGSNVQAASVSGYSRLAQPKRAAAGGVLSVPLSESTARSGTNAMAIVGPRRSAPAVNFGTAAARRAGGRIDAFRKIDDERMGRQD